MPPEDAEALVVGVCGKRRARRTRFLAPDLRAVELVDALGFRAQDLHLLGRECIRQEQPAFLVELLHLLIAELHGASSLVLCCCAASNCRAVASPAAAV